jgi:hypothetical protein
MEQFQRHIKCGLYLFQLQNELQQSSQIFQKLSKLSLNIGHHLKINHASNFIHKSS